MNQRFQIFVSSITQIYRCIQKLKNQEMADLGLKGTHVMCLYQLQLHPEGLTAVQLAQACEEDKAAISRSVAELRSLGLVENNTGSGRRYRMPIQLTAKGWEATEPMNQKILDSVMAGGQGYSPQEREIFYRVLLQVTENLQNACMAAPAKEEEL